MSAIIWSDVSSVAPELVSYGAQTLVLDYVNASVETGVFDGEDGPRTRMARILLAAHMATVALRADGAAGPVTSESAGGLSRSYASLASQRLLSSSSYGQLYLSIIDTSNARAPVVSGGNRRGCW